MNEIYLWIGTLALQTLFVLTDPRTSLVSQAGILTTSQPVYESKQRVDVMTHAEVQICLVLGDIAWVRSTYGEEGWIWSNEVVPLTSAVEFFSERIRKDLADHQAFFGRANTYFCKRDFDRAMSDINEAIRLNPADPEYRAFRGKIRADNNESDQAIRDCDEAIRLNKTCFEAYLCRGYARKLKGEFEFAIADYDEAIRLDPSFAFAYCLRASAYLEVTQNDKAMADFSESIALNANTQGGFAGRGYILSKMQEYPQAIDDLSTALRLNPCDEQSRLNRAHCWQSSGCYFSAEDDLQEAIRRNPNCVEAKSALAWLWSTCPNESCRHGDKAVTLVKEIMEANIDDGRRYSLDLGAAYAEVGDFENAITWAERALERAANENEKGYAKHCLKLFVQKKPLRAEKMESFDNVQASKSLEFLSGEVRPIPAVKKEQVSGP